MVVRMARGFVRLEFPSTYTMLRDSLLQVELSELALLHLLSQPDDPLLCRIGGIAVNANFRRLMATSGAYCLFVFFDERKPTISSQSGHQLYLTLKV